MPLILHRPLLTFEILRIVLQVAGDATYYGLRPDFRCGNVLRTLHGRDLI